MKFIDWFAGVGGFRRGMELAGHECVGFCEFDKYAVMSYTAMHLATDEQLKYLATLPMKERQKEILKEEYRNGEWYADDIRRVYAGDIPDADCWCFGFPCQDISVAGKQLGFKGSRSSLFYRVMYLAGQLEEEEKPEWLFIENVKNLLSVNGGWDFARLLTELDEGGYDAEWQVFNSKDFGVPQNRERCFIVGHLRDKGRREIFSFCTGDAKAIELEERSSGLNDDCEIGIIQVGNIVDDSSIGFKNPQRGRVYDPDGIGPAVNTCGGGGLQTKIIVRPCLTPDRLEKRQNGRRFKDDGEESFTLTSQDKHGVLLDDGQAIRIRRLTPKEYFRLQGWTDDYFEKAALVNNESQLYKQAGNGVTVNVIEWIAKCFKAEQWG